MAKRSSVGVLAAGAAATSDDNECHSIDCRRIDNGFIIRESHSKGGEYHSKETFSRTKPDIEPRRETNSGRETLRDAMKELRRS